MSISEQNLAAQSDEVLALANLLHLSRRARHVADDNESLYLAMNETHLLAPYRQAALCMGERVVALSGVVSPEANAPYVQWLTRLIGEIREPATANSGDEPKARAINANSISAAAREDWDEWLPLHALWLPLPAIGDHFDGGGWLLARDDPWQDDELPLLQEWAETWASAWALRHKPSAAERLDALKRRLRAALPGRAEFRALRQGLARPAEWSALYRRSWASVRVRWLVGVMALLLLPVRLTVLAPGELVAVNPAVIRAPLDGVVDRVLVQPNQRVKKGDVLFEFDRTTLASRLAVAEQALTTAEAEYRQYAQQALLDSRSKGQLGLSQGRVAEKHAEAAYLREMNLRAGVISPRDGVALFDDPTTWIGKPVTTGERVMMVTDEHDVEVEAWLAPFDVIDLELGAAVTLYLNVKPLSPVTARLRYLGHEAQQRSDGHFAYRLRAALPADEERPRVGLKGTAKVTGGWIPLGYWILRKPLAAARNFVGL